jgi:hypothetical protein
VITRRDGELELYDAVIAMFFEINDEDVVVAIVECAHGTEPCKQRAIRR